MADDSRQTLIVETNLQSTFYALVHDAANNQRLDANAETLHYLVNLLSAFTSSKSLFDHTADGLRLKPLAGLYAEAVAATTDDERNRCLKRLGDLALFIAGVFSDSLRRKPVDVDYYIAMGGNAYSYLSETGARAQRWQALCDIFDELASNFTAFVDLLSEVRDNTHLKSDSDTDILRLYELWLHTGSQRAEQKLRRLGVHPLRPDTARVGASPQRRH